VPIVGKCRTPREKKGLERSFAGGEVEWRQASTADSTTSVAVSPLQLPFLHSSTYLLL
jgi:hypothetical protein